MRRHRGLYDHLLADGGFNIAHDPGTEGRAAFQYSHDNKTLGLSVGKQCLPRVPAKNTRGGENRGGQQ